MKPIHPQSLYRPEYDQAVIEHLREGRSLTSFAGSIGVSRNTLDFWREEHESFREAVLVGKALCLAWWEDRALETARTGRGNAKLIVFALKNYGPHEFTDSKQIEHKGTAPTQVVQYYLPGNGREKT